MGNIDWTQVIITFINAIVGVVTWRAAKKQVRKSEAHANRAETVVASIPPLSMRAVDVSTLEPDHRNE